jgi:CHASE2 domain-containing sensor protein
VWRALKQRWAVQRAGAYRSALATVLFGLALWWLPLGRGLVHWSFDLPTVLGPRIVPEEILLIQLNESSLTELHQSFGKFSRTNHANLLKKLTAAPARLVVFDFHFPASEPRPEEDEALAEAIKKNGQVILASVYSQLPGYDAIGIAEPPLSNFVAVARGWGISRVVMDTDSAIRWHDAGSPNRASLAWVAAEALGALVSRAPESRFQTRWLRYYGDEGTLPAKPYHVALSMAPESFQDKIIFVGGKPETQPLSAQSDVFATPYTRWGGPLTSGMEIQATMFLNLWRNEFLTRMPAWAELCLLLVCGAGLGCGLTLVRPLAGLTWAVALIVVVAAAGCLLHWYGGFWFSWLVVAGAQVPCAWACAAVWHLQRLPRGKAVPEEPPGAREARATITVTVPTRDFGQPGAAARSASGSALPSVGTPAVRVVADHVLLRRIGKGAYGEVYLARSAVGLYHAVKLVFREDFREAEPYEREFRGIQKYMPVSLGHPGLVPLLHVGRNDEAGCFYYVMELGDDKSGSTKVDPETYAPKNLLEELKQRGHLPVTECIEMFVALTGALEYLHGEKLVHRDIKPSNIIFAKGLPKFTDIGLVTDLASTGQDVSYVGTEGYIPPEGPGTAAADVFSLGVVLYQAATGMDRRRVPELPATLTGRPDVGPLLQINRIILRACQPEMDKRYQSAAEMRQDLLRLRAAEK